VNAKFVPIIPFINILFITLSSVGFRTHDPIGIIFAQTEIPKLSRHTT